MSGSCWGNATLACPTHSGAPAPKFQVVGLVELVFLGVNPGVGSRSRRGQRPLCTSDRSQLARCRQSGTARARALFSEAAPPAISEVCAPDDLDIVQGGLLDESASMVMQAMLPAPGLPPLLDAPVVEQGGLAREAESQLVPIGVEGLPPPQAAGEEDIVEAGVVVPGPSAPAEALQRDPDFPHMVDGARLREEVWDEPGKRYVRYALVCQHHKGCEKRRGGGASQRNNFGRCEPYAYLAVWHQYGARCTKQQHSAYRPTLRDQEDWLRGQGLL